MAQPNSTSAPQRPVDPALLQPISAHSPCGPSLEYDPEYAVLRARLAPRGEAQYGQFVNATEGPDWAEIERDCRRLLARTKDITLWVWLCRARTRLGQAAGLAQVLATLCAALEAWPEHLHPQAVLEGEFDPGVRANALAALADPDGLLGDVREIVVSASTAMRLTVRDVERAFAVPRLADAPLPEPVSRQLAALRRSGDEAALQLALAADAVGRIDTWCHLRLGDDAPSLEALQQLLVAFTEVGAAPARPASPTTQPAPMRSASAPASQPGGPIASREDARDSIREAREWFELHEPSSPVAVLLKQAEHLVGRRFAEIAQSIPPELLQKWDTDPDIRTVA